MVSKIDGKMFARMIQQGAQNLSNNADLIDSLNVYPVPDGDTGTNMNLTMSSGKEAVANQGNIHIGEVGAVFSKGLLMGARGNSGVILSQIFRGFCKQIEDLETIDISNLADAIQAGADTAYQAIIQPVEGTILTVAKDMAKAATQLKQSVTHLEEFFKQLLEEANRSLENTPNLLPVLKEVGVVDSGGKGLVTIFEGFFAAIQGKEITPHRQGVPSDEDLSTESHEFHGVINTEDIKYGYCTEVMARFNAKQKSGKFDVEDFKDKMSQFGDSLLVVNDDEIVKVHVHTEKPGDVFNYVQTFGELIKLKVENMREQHREVVKKERQSSEEDIKTVDRAIIVVSMGEGITEIFKSMGATHVIHGGQTMNPSTEDIARVIEQSQCKEAIILPNNKNIIMASEQAAELVNANVEVVPSKSIPQGVAALFHVNHDNDLHEIKEEMVEALTTVSSASITQAVRDTQIDGLQIYKEDFIGLKEDKIVTSSSDLLQTLKSLIRHLLTEESEIITLITGQDSEEAITNEVINYIEQDYPDIEVDIQNGQQPIYPYLMSVE
ncbi:DAK2 domain-containing protein [Staphylococcus sp. SQ8-PEA]|uniref:DAK2 domain-containing protein n=1 Tax=Staphylococcus marylandisciuri TaxID=2981529 RepID=A0ABT2QP48_9STAP|nr:DAK2 domain-containing protein [Staphylococcus marylandisciuri]MCU5745756.1 DAK2 domain-containing protein [Staphylococcus marylandisciuri]